jgi:hypothetical protein
MEFSDIALFGSASIGSLEQVQTSSFTVKTRTDNQSF